MKYGKKPLSDRLTRRIVTMVILGVVLTFLLPQMVHYPLAYYLEKRGYQVCKEASYQWLLYRKIVFTNDLATCLDMASKNE